MKKLSTLLLVLALVGFSACGKKKNKVDENAVANQFCQNGVCYTNTGSGSGYTGPINTPQELALAMASGAFRNQTNPTETHVFVTGTIDVSSDSWFIFDWNTSNFNQTSTYNVISSTSGSVSGNPYGTSLQGVLNNLVAQANGAQAMARVNTQSGQVYKILAASGDVLYIDFNQPLGANPTQIESANGANGEVTFRQNSYSGF
jgi:hypothetical protein